MTMSRKEGVPQEGHWEKGVRGDPKRGLSEVHPLNPTTPRPLKSSVGFREKLQDAKKLRWKPSSPERVVGARGFGPETHFGYWTEA